MFLTRLFVLSIAVLLAGCWIPEKFSARVLINEDGSYSFAYDGILTLGLALEAAKDGKLSPKDEAAFKTVGEQLQRDPGFKKVAYAGNGRYEVLVEQNHKAGESMRFVSKEAAIFSVVPKKDGTVEVSGFKLSEKDMKELRRIGAKVDGYLRVSVAKGAEVVKHNADSSPKLFGLFGDYEWHIKSPDAVPFIVIRPSVSLPVSDQKDAATEKGKGVNDAKTHSVSKLRERLNARPNEPSRYKGF